MNQIVLGDPGAGTPQFYLTMPDPNGGTVLVINESPYGLDFTINRNTYRVPADHWREIPVKGAVPLPVTWGIANNTNASVASVSDVVVECYGLDECPAVNTTPMGRQTNVGNSSLPVTSTSTLINDGNAAGTVIVEATPSGAAGSQAKLTNDGAFICGGGLFVISNAGVVTAIPANAIPAAAISGTVSSAGSLNQQITSQDNGTAQLRSTVNARGIALGYNDSGGTYHQVLGVNGTTGAVTAPNASIPAAAIAAGTLGAGVDLATLSSDGGAITSDGAGNLTLAGNLDAGNTLLFGSKVGTSQSQVFYLPAINAIQMETPQAGASALGIAFGTYTGSAGAISFSIGGQFNGALSYVSDLGTFVPGGGGSLYGVHAISGSGSATVTHGLTIVPDAAVVNTNNGSNSTTYGSGSYTATTVFVYQFSAMAWTGLVYRH